MTELHIDRLTINGTEKLAVGPDEAAAMLSIGRDKVFELVLSGALPSFKIGSRRLIPTAGLRAYVERRAGECAT